MTKRFRNYLHWMYKPGNLPAIRNNREKKWWILKKYNSQKWITNGFRSVVQPLKLVFDSGFDEEEKERLLEAFEKGNVQLYTSPDQDTKLKIEFLDPPPVAKKERKNRGHYINPINRETKAREKRRKAMLKLLSAKSELSFFKSLAGYVDPYPLSEKLKEEFKRSIGAGYVISGTDMYVKSNTDVDFNIWAAEDVIADGPGMAVTFTVHPGLHYGAGKYSHVAKKGMIYNGDQLLYVCHVNKDVDYKHKVTVAPYKSEHRIHILKDKKMLYSPVGLATQSRINEIDESIGKFTFFSPFPKVSGLGFRHDPDTFNLQQPATDE